MILMVEFNGDTEEEVRTKIRKLHQELGACVPATKLTALKKRQQKPPVKILDHASAQFPAAQEQGKR